MTVQPYAAQPILRFAPSPNGRLHLGHAFSALFTDHWARQMGGTWLLRIEDIDFTRCRADYVDGIFEDLAWLGLDWPKPALIQSARVPAHADAADRLMDMGLTYPCFCSRRRIAEAATDADPDGAPLYPGTCRHLGPEQIAARLDAGERPNWRLDMALALEMTGPLHMALAEPTPDRDPLLLPADPMRWGDVVVRRKDIGTSYHLGVVVDDAMQAVTHVTRGTDLKAATDIHVVLQALLQIKSPIYCHHGLITDDTSLKLAKSRGSQSLADLRAEGVTPARIRAELGF